MVRLTPLALGCALLGSAVAGAVGCDGGGSSRSTVAIGTVWVARDLGTLGGNSEAADVNERGQVVGWSSVVRGGRLRRHAFLWENGKMVDLGTLPGGKYSRAVAINDRGDVVGWGEVEGYFHRRAVLWRMGRIVDLGTLGGDSSVAIAINGRGQVVGGSVTASGEEHAFLWERGVMTDLGTLGGPSSMPVAINDRGQVIGKSEAGDGTEHAFLWEDGRMRALTPSGRGFSEAADLNDTGEVVGASRQDAGVWRGFAYRWRSGQTTDLPAPELSRSCAAAVNALGQVAGNIGNRAALWRDGEAIDLGVAGAARSIAVAMNDHGLVVGRILFETDAAPQSHAFVWENGELTDLGTLPGGGFGEAVAVSAAYAINEDGQIAGAVARKDSPSALVGWSPCRGVEIPGPRDTRYTRSGWEHAVLWTRQTS